MSTVESVRRIIRGHRWRLEVESTLQAEISAQLTAAAIAHEREVRLDAKNRIDFLVGSVGIEVKIKGAKRDIYRQIERYTEFDEIAEIVLLTNVAVRMPATISGKPVHVIPLTSALA